MKNNIIYFYLLFFLTISYLSIYNACFYFSDLGNLYFKQLIWYFFGIIIILIIKKVKLNNILKYSIHLYIILVILLIGLFLFGSEINNSKAWYSLGIISIQPSEFMKISIILLDSFIIRKFYKNKSTINSKKEKKLIILLFLIFLIPSILTFIEPDTGSVICYLFITLSYIYILNINKKLFKKIIGFSCFIIILFLSFYFFFKDLFINIFGTGFFYRMDRLISWKLKDGIQLNNSLIVIGSSGILGHSKIPIYYPELETDFIFTTFSSIYGIIGGILLIIVVFSFDLYILKLIKIESNKQNKYLLFSIFSLFFYQHVQSIGMALGLLPIIGITFPLLSYGGSSILTYLILIGIIINIKEKV